MLPNTRPAPTGTVPQSPQHADVLPITRDGQPGGKAWLLALRVSLEPGEQSLTWAYSYELFANSQRANLKLNGLLNSALTERSAQTCNHRPARAASQITSHRGWGDIAREQLRALGCQEVTSHQRDQQLPSARRKGLGAAVTSALPSFPARQQRRWVLFRRVPPSAAIRAFAAAEPPLLPVLALPHLSSLCPGEGRGGGKGRLAVAGGNGRCGPAASSRRAPWAASSGARGRARAPSSAPT